MLSEVVIIGVGFGLGYAIIFSIETWFEFIAWVIVSLTSIFMNYNHQPYTKSCSLLVILIYHLIVLGIVFLWWLVLRVGIFYDISVFIDVVSTDHLLHLLVIIVLAVALIILPHQFTHLFVHMLHGLGSVKDEGDCTSSPQAKVPFLLGFH